MIIVIVLNHGNGDLACPGCDDHDRNDDNSYHALHNTQRVNFLTIQALVPTFIKYKKNDNSNMIISLNNLYKKTIFHYANNNNSHPGSLA